MTDHEQNLIDQYNRNRLHADWVYTIEELNRRVLEQEIESLRKNSNGVNHDHE